MDCLTAIIIPQPHAAYATLTHGLSNKWSYLARTIHGIGPLLQPLETIIRSKLPACTGQPPHNNEICDLLAIYSLDSS